VIRFSLNHSNAITSVSESLKKDTLSTFKIDNKINVIPNFINIKDYEVSLETCSSRMYARHGERILVHISNFRKVKRVQDVLGIFDIVRKEVPSKLILVGDGPEKQYIEQLSRQMNIHQDVINLGKIADPKEILAMADLFLLPSETESFGLSALEALAMKVPVISTVTGGLPEVNVNGVTGFLSKVGDVKEMGANALKLLKDDKLHAQFRNSAFEQAKKFDLEKILPQYIKLYEQLMVRETVG
jgi:N-acetyl-alpha-D-glucosaminyl L-malate synthase BshA